VIAALEEQRDDEDPVTTFPPRNLGPRRFADQRVEDRFEPRAGRRIGEHDLAQAGAVEGAVGPAQRGAEGGEDGRMARLAGRRQRVREAIGVVIPSAAIVGDRSLAAADAASEADDEGHGR
jgi:hypothetical protein